MAWMGGLAIAVLGALQLAHIWFFQRLRNQAQAAGLQSDHVYFQFIRDRQAELNFISGLTFLLVLCIVFVVGLILSHRVAGPMHRLKKHFEMQAATELLSPVAFRNGDYFQEVAEAYNLQFEKTKGALEKKAQ